MYSTKIQYTNILNITQNIFIFFLNNSFKIILYIKKNAVCLLHFSKIIFTNNTNT